MLIRILAIVSFAAVSWSSQVQSAEQKAELFAKHFSDTAVLFSVSISPEKCAKIIRQADDILVAHPEDGFASLDSRDLAVASLNLRVCATSNLARMDRDLAVGLYGETIAERHQRLRQESKPR